MVSHFFGSLSIKKSRFCLFDVCQLVAFVVVVVVVVPGAGKFIMVIIPNM